MSRGKVKFLDEVGENEKVEVEVFITRIYQVFVYFCQRCNKVSARMCDCGNFPQARLKLEGAISDGSKTMVFRTVSDKVDQEFDKKNGEGATEKEISRELMSKSHLLTGYCKGDKFFVESIR